MSKKLHVNCYLLADHEAEALRQLVREYNEPASYEEYQADNYADRPPLVEILYEESSKGKTGFDLWFVSPAVAFYFGAAWGQRLVALAQAPAEAPYPRFLYSARLGYFCRQNAPGHFCLVSKTQIQVRREAEQHLFDPGDWQASDEGLFLAAFFRQRDELRECATKAATYQRRGAPGNEWFYCNPLSAGASLPQHVRLNCRRTTTAAPGSSCGPTIQAAMTRGAWPARSRSSPSSSRPCWPTPRPWPPASRREGCRVAKRYSVRIDKGAAWFA